MIVLLFAYLVQFCYAMYAVYNHIQGMNKKRGVGFMRIETAVVTKLETHVRTTDPLQFGVNGNIYVALIIATFCRIIWALDPHPNSAVLGVHIC